jgi:hypothetical protein
MPFGLGFFATAGVRAAAGSFDLLQTQVLSSAEPSVTFSNLNTAYGSTYQHLQIRMVTKDTSAGAASYDLIRLNGDTGSNYSWHRLQADGSSVASTAGTSTNGMNAYLNAYQSAANAFSVSVFDLLDPFETTKNKTIRVLTGGALGSFNYVALTSGNWRNTASVTSVTINASANFVVGSRFSLYGIKAA